MSKLQGLSPNAAINLEVRQENQKQSICRAAKRDAPNLGFQALCPGCDSWAFALHDPWDSPIRDEADPAPIIRPK